MNTRTNRSVLLFAYFLSAAIFSLVVTNGISNATTAGFEAGRIIDDVVFTNYQAMDVAQIQGFLNSKVSSCDTYGTKPASDFGRSDITHAQYAASRGWSAPPYTCLKDYSEKGLSAAQIIYNMSQTYQINPQVFLVLLQKEQGLVTDTWPLATQYRTATGYGCPDTAPCDTEYYGFTNQVDWSGYMFRAIFNASPTWYTPYVLGNNYIQYSPNGACGGTTVSITNRSTQSLYNYTPYQPNQAALNAGYGTGNSCSAYGNRNFYNYFTDWFGPTQRALITSVGMGIYLVENNQKRPFPSEIVFLSQYNKWSSVLNVSNAEISLIPDGAAMAYNTHFRDGQIVTSPGNGVYLIENGLKRPFPSEALFILYGYQWKNVINISSAEMSMIPDGAIISYDTHSKDGRLVTSVGMGIYLIENGLKRPFPSEMSFISNSYSWANVINITNAEISLIPNGSAMPYNTHYRDGHLVTSPGKGIYVISDGYKRPFPSEAAFISYSYTFASALSISNAEISLIPEGAAMPYNTHYRDGRLITSAGKGIFLVENGYKRPFPSEAIFLSYSYSWNNVINTSNAEMSLIPDGSAMEYKS